MSNGWAPSGPSPPGNLRLAIRPTFCTVLILGARSHWQDSTGEGPESHRKTVSVLHKGSPQAPTFPVCGVPIAVLTPHAATERLLRAAVARQRLEVHLCNAYTLSLVGRDSRLMDCLRSADLNLPDGTPVSWLGRKWGASGPVRGPQLVQDVAMAGQELGIRHFLYGGAPGVADHMAANLRQIAPGIEIAGTESPPFRDLTYEDLAATAARITAAGADMVWIGLGTPKQDYAVADLGALLDLPLAPVGAAFDFLAGTVKPAPAWLHGSGLEWVYRLGAEPRRLWRRYLFGNPRFLYRVWRSRAAGRP